LFTLGLKVANRTHVDVLVGVVDILCVDFIIS